MTSVAGDGPVIAAADDPVLQLAVRRWRQGAWQDTLDWFSQYLAAGGPTPEATPEG